jgi:hypothetical protein
MEIEVLKSAVAASLSIVSVSLAVARVKIADLSRDFPKLQQDKSNANK